MRDYYWLSLPVLVLLVGAVLVAHRLGSKKEGRNGMRTKTPWWCRIRWNVLILVLAGYVTTLVIFILLIRETNIERDQAFLIVQGPLMTLIGGSLAIAKDLIQSDTPVGNHENDHREGKKEQDDDGTDQVTKP